LKLELLVNGLSGGIDEPTLLIGDSGLLVIGTPDGDSRYSISDQSRIELDDVPLMRIRSQRLKVRDCIEDRYGELRILLPRESCVIKRQAACPACPFRSQVESGNPAPDGLTVQQELKARHRFLRIQTCCPDAGTMKNIRSIFRRATGKRTTGILAGWLPNDGIELRLLKSAGASVLIHPEWQMGEVMSRRELPLVHEKGGWVKPETYKTIFDAVGVEIKLIKDRKAEIAGILDDAFSRELLPKLTFPNTGFSLDTDKAGDLVNRLTRWWERRNWAIPKTPGTWSPDSITQVEWRLTFGSGTGKKSKSRRPPRSVVYFL
jgi:hypothetical protein